MSRIVMISPFKQLAAAVDQVAAELGIPVEIYEGGMESACDVISRLKGPEVDVFISRGGTSAYIARATSTPVINITTGLYDIMEACEEARKLSRNIIITTYGSKFVGMRLLEKAMDIQITEVVFHSLPDLENSIMELAAEGAYYCVVGGGQSVPAAKKYGLPAVFLRASLDTIRDVLLQAAEVARLRREEKRKAFRLKAILDSVYDGIIALDASGRLEIINPAAERMLSIKAAEVIGKEAASVIPNTRLHNVLRTGKPEIGELQDLGAVHIVTNRVPIKDDTEVMGAVATFQETSRVIQVEQRLRREMVKNRFQAKYSLQQILGDSAVIAETKELARNFAFSDLTVLIYGPSGSGKEMFAQGIHSAGRRKNQPFVAVNCAALPPSLLESELFGYEEGAFTGAKRKGKLGMFELAHGGTVFLDEIDALPIDLQGRLLRVLQEREVLRVGGENIIPVNIRVTAATNKPPHELVKAGKMREDLYYRLNVLYLEIPALQERKDDILPLCRHFLGELADKDANALLAGVLPYLLSYSWPGNVRELHNFCQRVSFYQEWFQQHQDAEKLIRKIAPAMLAEQDAKPVAAGLQGRVDAFESAIIRKALQEEGSLRKAAAKLGVPKTTLARKISSQKRDNTVPETGRDE
jgi:propionate catabolism operon transcriptional regulator